MKEKESKVKVVVQGSLDDRVMSTAQKVAEALGGCLEFSFDRESGEIKVSPARDSEDKEGRLKSRFESYREIYLALLALREAKERFREIPGGLSREKNEKYFWDVRNAGYTLEDLHETLTSVSDMAIRVEDEVFTLGVLRRHELVYEAPHPSNEIAVVVVGRCGSEWVVWSRNTQTGGCHNGSYFDGEDDAVKEFARRAGMTWSENGYVGARELRDRLEECRRKRVYTRNSADSP